MTDRHLLDPGKPPADLDLEGRTRLFGGAMLALSRRRWPTEEQLQFLVGGGLGWLEEDERGVDLVRDRWKLVGRQGSTITAPAIWRALREERQREEDEAKSADSNIAPDTQ